MSRRCAGDALTGLSLLTGTERAGAQKAIAPLAVTLAAGVTLPAGSIAGNASDPTPQLVTLAAVASANALALR
ncbi:MAG: hypothetical protein EPO40_21365 [Myxococcaceae bacterium]|nr:MAG: hypothetical protein EPO40_21365 [Myxococcaceae bacterium]